MCSWCGTRFKIFLRSPPGYPKTIPIARVNSCRFSIALWCTSTFRGGSSRRRLALPGGAVSRPHHLPGCRGGPPACVRGVGRVSRNIFVAPRATPKPSILPESTLVGFPLDCGAQAPPGGGRPDGAWRSREGRSAAHTHIPPASNALWACSLRCATGTPGAPALVVIAHAVHPAIRL